MFILLLLRETGFERHVYGGESVVCPLRVTPLSLITATLTFT
jgi:hypothetical protein